MPHSIIRATFVLVTVLVTLAAVLVSAGRLFVHNLDDAKVNRLLAAQSIEVVAVRGRWRLLNPIVEVDELRLGDSTFHSVVLELDWVESLLRRSLVLAHLSVRDANLTLAHAEDRGWHLAGMPAGPGNLAWFDTVYQSDELEFNGTLAFVRGEHQGALRLDARAVNRGGSHRIDATVAEPACPDDCLLRIRFDDREALWPLWYRELAASVASSPAGVAIPKPLLAGASARLTQADVRWDRTATRLGSGIAADAGIGAGVNFVAVLEDVTAPGGRPFSLALSGNGTSSGGIATAEIVDAKVVVDDTNQWVLPPVWMQWSSADVRLFSERLDVGELVDFVALTRLPEDRLANWIHQLAPQGQLGDFRLRRTHLNGELDYSVSIQGLDLAGFKGVPLVHDFDSQVLGADRRIRLEVADPSLEFGLPNQFVQPWRLQAASAELTGVYRNGVIRLQGRDIQAQFDQHNSATPHQVHGSFAIAIPPDRSAQTLALNIDASEAVLATAKTFIPKNVAPGLRNFLLEAPEVGSLANLQLAYIGTLRGDQGPKTRRIALTGDMRDVRLRYQSNWPRVEKLYASLAVSGGRFDAQVSAGETLGVPLKNLQVAVPQDSRQVLLRLNEYLLINQALTLVRLSPLQEQLSFVGPNWYGNGGLGVRGDVFIPLDAQEDGEPAPVKARLRFEFADLDVRLPEYRIDLNSLKGVLNYESPNRVTGENIVGQLFDSALRADVITKPASSADLGDEIEFQLLGQITPADVYQLLDMTDSGIAQGNAAYAAKLRFPIGGEPNLELESNLLGMTLGLPGQLGKLGEDENSLRVHARFIDDQRQWINLTLADMVGFVSVVGGGVQRGAMGLGMLPLAQPESARTIWMTGSLTDFDIASLAANEGSGEGSDTDPVYSDLPLTFKDLQIEALSLDDVDLASVTINGDLLADRFDLSLQGERLAGTVAQGKRGRLRINLDHLRLPDTSPEVGDVSLEDPLDIGMITDLVKARVELKSVWVGDEDYGSWRFNATPINGDLKLTKVMANLRGVAITADEVRWHGGANNTEFTGQLVAGDLAEVLPQWDYAGSLKTKRADLSADLVWPGSPLNFELSRLVGELDFAAREGSFIDVEGGSNALRIFSLLNFTAITKRMSLDFSDVVGKGISFDKVDAKVALNAGMLRFIEPMEVEGTGSSFRFGGRVNMVTEELDNEMLVTLPVSKSLPWYAAYIAIANPLAGLGVLVGERVLRKPLQAFSSAKYQISGTLDDPEVQFVSLFDTKMATENAPALEEGLKEAAQETPAAVPEPTEQDAQAGAQTPNPPATKTAGK